MLLKIVYRYALMLQKLLPLLIRTGRYVLSPFKVLLMFITRRIETFEDRNFEDWNFEDRKES
jgi:hypothetical protein